MAPASAVSPRRRARRCAVMPALNTDRFAVNQRVGDLAPSGVDHAGKGLSRDTHLPTGKGGIFRFFTMLPKIDIMAAKVSASSDLR